MSFAIDDNKLLEKDIIISTKIKDSKISEQNDLPVYYDSI